MGPLAFEINGDGLYAYCPASSLRVGIAQGFNLQIQIWVGDRFDVTRTVARMHVLCVRCCVSHAIAVLGRRDSEQLFSRRLPTCYSELKIVN